MSIQLALRIPVNDFLTDIIQSTQSDMDKRDIEGRLLSNEQQMASTRTKRGRKVSQRGVHDSNDANVYKDREGKAHPVPKEDNNNMFRINFDPFQSIFCGRHI